MARRALQVVRHGPVKLVAVRLANHVRHYRSDAAELRVAERVARPGLGEEFAVRVGGALRDDDDTVAVCGDALLGALQEAFLVERDLRKQDDVRRLAGLAAREPP